ncbi:MAG TPA: tRNA lysidine(34) synthetase TilS [Phnomibacter sp.]|nr:tRNA lysidine(34) synthetase TilS [Phnomibacter sp.]
MLHTNLPAAFSAYIHTYQLLPKDASVLLAMSGGVDSVVLAHLFRSTAIPFTIAHCNFQLRGDESVRDENFVRSLAQQWQVPLLVKHFDTKEYATTHACSIQVAARNLRYDWFQACVRTSDITQLIATAHHANDSVETMLMNLMRGTGIEGLHGILPRRGNIIRPLLFATKEEIIDHAKKHDLNWVEDSSNDSSKYTRNFIRNEMIPAAEKIFPAAVKNMLGTIQKMQEAELLYTQAIAQHKSKLLQREKGEFKIPVLLLLKAKPLRSITWELIKGFDFTEGQVDEVLKLCTAATGAYVQSASWRIIRHRKWLLIAPVQTAIATTLVVEGNNGELQMPQGTLTWKTLDAVDANAYKQLKPAEAMLDARQLAFPLVLRPWKAGDYLYPLGMRKKKKLARLLIDLKLSTTEKEKVWVLESQQKIVWVLGLRIDDRFKLTAQTGQVVHLHFKPV